MQKIYHEAKSQKLHVEVVLLERRQEPTEKYYRKQTFAKSCLVFRCNAKYLLQSIGLKRILKVGTEQDHRTECECLTDVRP